MNGSSFSCAMCGRCCRLVIPLTLLDIQQLAEYLDADPREIFQEYVENRAKENVLTLVKNAGGQCPFLGDDNTCAVHDAKPWVCRVYTCDQEAGDARGMPWGVRYNNAAGHRTLWRMVVATNETERYAATHGGQWHREDFQTAVAAIRTKAHLNETQRVKLARGEDGETHAILYDCTGCKDRPTCCKEAPITLDDVTRLAAHLRMPVDELFAAYVSGGPTTLAEGLLALRTREGDRCPFLEPSALVCTVERRRPMHCQFIPCTQLAGDDQIAERFYLGSGSLEQQFRHQVATAVTRRYIAQYGRAYHTGGFENLTNLLEKLAADRAEFVNFCETIAPHRYIDDNMLAVKGQSRTARTI